MSNGATLFKGNYRGCAKSPTVGSFASLINAAKSGIVKYGGGDGTGSTAGGCCDKTCDNAAGSIPVQTALPGQTTASKTSSGGGSTQTGWISQAPMTYGGGTLGG